MELPPAAMVVTVVLADLADALPRVGAGSLIVSPRLPLTLSLRRSEATTTVFLYAAIISSIHRVGTKPAVLTSLTMTFTPPNAMIYSEKKKGDFERGLLQRVANVVALSAPEW